MTDLDNGYLLEVVWQLRLQSLQRRREECDWFSGLATFLPDQTSRHIGPPGRKGRLDYGAEGQNVSQYKCTAKCPFERSCRAVSCGTHRTFVPLASASERMAESIYLSLSRVSTILSESGSMELGCRIFPWRATVVFVSMICYRRGEVFGTIFFETSNLICLREAC